MTNALIDASKKGDMNSVKLLLEGAVVNRADENGDTALIHASNEKHIEIVKLLLEKGADVNALTKKAIRL